MEYRLESGRLNDYLQESRYVDYHHPAIQQEAGLLFAGCTNDLEKILLAFTFVRDELPHSGDIHSSRVTRTASEALRFREGICYAKSMLLAALLRRAGIPVGFCYQRLARHRPEGGYCIHALNAVYIAERDHWTRVDARGNTGRKNAQFFPDDPCREQVAVPVHPEQGEIDYPTIYVEPLKCTTDVLEQNDDCREMLAKHLPSRL